MILQTERLYLREMTYDDRLELCKILQDEETMYAYEHAFSDEEVDVWMQRNLDRYRDYGFGLWAVVRRDTDEFLGQTGLSIQRWCDVEVLEIGYLFKRRHWHKGYATEAASGCKRYAFEVLKELEVFSIIRDTNDASQRVAERDGMKKRGQFLKSYYGMDMLHYVFSVKRQQ